MNNQRIDTINGHPLKTRHNPSTDNVKMKECQDFWVDHCFSDSRIKS